MLRSFAFNTLAHHWAIGLPLTPVVLLLLRRRDCRPFMRLLLARPLWWLGARFLGLPDASAGYARFRERAVAKWEALLLGEKPNRDGCS
jgi:hypothetical protein